jgi:DNA-directed RNA polymerase II subunit RPB2
MIAVFKTMEVARHVLRTYFRDQAFPLIQHHIDSFNALVDVDIPTFIRVSNPITLELDDPKIGPNLTRFIRVYVGGKDGNKLRFASPTEDDGTAVTPHGCRLDNQTYSLSIYADLLVEYEHTDPATKRAIVTPVEFPNILIGKIPLMLRSKYCYLTGIPGETIGECKFELGGYFVIDGSERVLVTRELLGNNMMSGSSRAYAPPKQASGATMVEMSQPIDPMRRQDGASESISYDEEKREIYVMTKTLSEDGARGPYWHFLSLPPEVISKSVDKSTGEVNVSRSMRRLMAIQLPGFQNAVPVVSIFRALGCVTDRDIYESILAGVPDRERLAYDDLFYEMIMSHETVITKERDMAVLVEQTRNRSKANVALAIHEMLFSNIEGGDEDTGARFRRKAYALGQMVRTAFDIALGRRKGTDRDNMQFKRFKTSGTLCFEEFRRNYREITDTMLRQMDMRVHYEADNYKGAKLSELLSAEKMGVYWKQYIMLNNFSKAFKGAWGGKVGISQILTRPSYLSAIYHLRETMLDIDRTISTAPPRRLFASQFGIMCPIDSPDGSDVGYKKALTVLSRVSVAFPVSKVREVVQSTGTFRPIENIHPSTWKPEWTRIYLNSDLIGVCDGNTEDFHRNMLGNRRTGKLDASVSLAWMRVNNEYKIYCDAGRPVRPVYREGVTAEQVMAADSWEKLSQLLDYIDASETDSLAISLEPFHPTRVSEIHMTFNLSACTNLVPYADHNPAPRSVFSIAQQKSAASWYHTNYMKRFDTGGLLLAMPQKPLSQTWMYNEIMGRGGCMPYGINAIVAITTYGGNNQEDSVTMNGTSMKRGMYQTMYFHTYTLEEDVIDPVGKIFTRVGNPTKYETVKRIPDKDYSKLDANGIVRVGTIVDASTVLVGHLRPKISGTGVIESYSDASMSAKRGQVGRVDAVYTYATADGRRGVKVRIAEERFPIVGDKMGSRHSQKGTIGQILPEEDMPFTKDGLRPDLIFNPHGIPTRMTVGQFLEAASNKLGVRLGSFVDATPFTTTNRIGDLRVAMNRLGFEQYGSEVLYNGQTGEIMDAEIFVGPIYYQRLKQMAEDKINYRSTGPKKLVTRQPTQGRGNEGGMRIGEMERDGLIAHGMSKFIRESFMERSDQFTAQFDKETGRIGEGKDEIEVPYAMSLFAQELDSMHVSVKLETQ